MILLWLLLGLLLVSPLIFITRKLRGKRLVHIMGSSLVIAALIYIGFAIIWGDTKWLATEFVGVLLYSAFYWLALQRGLVWLAIGWPLAGYCILSGMLHCIYLAREHILRLPGTPGRAFHLMLYWLLIC